MTNFVLRNSCDINQVESQLIGSINGIFRRKTVLFHHIIGGEFREFYLRIHNVRVGVKLADFVVEGVGFATAAEIAHAEFEIRRFVFGINLCGVEIGEVFQKLLAGGLHCGAGVLSRTRVNLNAVAFYAVALVGIGVSANHLRELGVLVERNLAVAGLRVVELVEKVVALCAGCACGNYGNQYGEKQSFSHCVSVFAPQRYKNVEC